MINVTMNMRKERISCDSLNENLYSLKILRKIFWHLEYLSEYIVPIKVEQVLVRNRWMHFFFQLLLITSFKSYFNNYGVQNLTYEKEHIFIAKFWRKIFFSKMRHFLKNHFTEIRGARTNFCEWVIV